MNTPCKVSILGWGAIGRTVGLALVDGQVSGARLHTVATLGRPGDCPVPLVDPAAVAHGADIVVEAAGQDALRAHGEQILTAGCRLLVVSAGALADRELFDRLRTVGGPRLAVTTGAIGGLDLLGAARRAGPVRELVLTTTKRPEVLVQAWMDDDLRDRLRSGTERVAVFDGPAADAVRLFPQSVNAAATLALAAGSWDVVRVQVVGDPTAERNRHEIRFEGAAGRYHLTIENEPSVTNPKTSGIVPYAVLRGLEHWVAEDWTLI